MENLINWQERPPRLGGGAFFVVIRELKQVPKVEKDSDEPDEFATEQVRFFRELRINDPGVYQARLWKDLRVH